MNILNLATTDEGGAGVASRMLNDMFLKAGCNSLLVVKESSLTNDNVVVLQRPIQEKSFQYYLNKIRQKFLNVYRRFDPLNIDSNYSFYNLYESKQHYSAQKIVKQLPFKPDVILVYWISEFLNTKTMQELTALTGAKIFWMMTDNAPLTGGCHYPWQCEGFHTDCSNCPAIFTDSKKIIAQKNLAFKKANIPENLELVTSSVSDHERALKASLFKGKKVHKIVAAIDPLKYTPGDKALAKAHFGIDPATRVMFYGAGSFVYPRKGGKQVVEALGLLQKKLQETGAAVNMKNDFLILIAGNDGEEYFSKINIPFKRVGYLNEENLIKAYQAADFSLSPSLEDSGPLMVNQCIMCGTPMVAFNTGVAMDLVRKGETGYIAKLFDSADLAEGIRYMLSVSDRELRQMSENCRNFALANITPAIYTQKLLSLFQT
jgi:glycosyltransferase involved in cell wall biosynthesis